MKLLAFSDLHRDVRAAKRLVELSQGCDIAIGAGDFGNTRRHISDCVDILGQMKIPLLVVPGNNESAEELESASSSWDRIIPLHAKTYQFKGFSFYGIGGGIPVTPFGDWSYDFSEEEAREILKPCPSRCILISHSPPKGILDLSAQGVHLGSIAIREIIDRVDPRLIVCGHIHNCGGRTELIRQTLVVNAGPKGVILNITDEESGSISVEEGIS